MSKKTVLFEQPGDRGYYETFSIYKENEN